MEILFLVGANRTQAFKATLEHDFELAGVVYTENSREKVQEVRKLATKHDVEVYEINHEDLKTIVESINPDILLSAGYRKIIDGEVLDLVEYPINLHPSLLPEYRGLRSGPYVIMNDEDKTGVTAHLMTEEVDAGDILHQKEIELTKFDTIKSLQRKAYSTEGELVTETLNRLESGELEPRPQDPDEATEYSDQRTPDDSELDWNKPLKELYDQIRASDPENYPAHFYVNGEKVCINLWRPNKPEDEDDMI